MSKISLLFHQFSTRHGRDQFHLLSFIILTFEKYLKLMGLCKEHAHLCFPRINEKCVNQNDRFYQKSSLDFPSCNNYLVAQACLLTVAILINKIELIGVKRLPLQFQILSRNFVTGSKFQIRALINFNSLCQI